MDKQGLTDALKDKEERIARLEEELHEEQLLVALWGGHMEDVKLEHKKTLKRAEAVFSSLLEVAERSHRGDPSLDPEEWYATRDAARLELKKIREWREEHGE